jgi:acetylornithine deacetylase/succinyl-diaminopimelate desuccinylase-like protein
MSDERLLAERLIGYETSRPETIAAAAQFVKGWLEVGGVSVLEIDHHGLPVLVAEVGAPAAADAPCVVFHGHLDVVPGRAEQFSARVEGDRLIGRGAYDMKGGLAAMLCALRDVAGQKDVRVRMVVVPDEESSEMFDRPSINLSRIEGGDAMNKVPDLATIAVDVRYLPGQDPGDILAQVRAIPGIDVSRTFIHPAVGVSRHDPYVRGLCDAARRSIQGEVTSVGRDGASDAASFIEAGISAVEFGPTGGGHHGPEEWVSLRSLAEYRRALVEFVRALPAALAGEDGELRAIDGGLA